MSYACEVREMNTNCKYDQVEVKKREKEEKKESGMVMNFAHYKTYKLRVH